MPAAYQRVIFNGIPYWRSADANLYYYESSTIPTVMTLLGNETTGLVPDWTTRLQESLASYRAESKSRARAKAVKAP